MQNVFLAGLTTLGIGGRADEVYSPSEQDFAASLARAKDTHEKVIIIGRGSKLLCSDDGYRGCVVLTKNLNRIEFSGDCVYAAAGVPLPQLSLDCAAAGLSGLEWASGIPASIGGAVTLNAGAYGGTMADIVEEVALTDGEASNAEAGFAYRDSTFSGGRGVVKGAWLRLCHAEKDDILRRMREVRALRRSSQPVGVRTAGSTFQRMNNQSAGWYIERVGCKGMAVGGASVSTVHANFIQNNGGATCKDVQKLINYISTEVYAQFGVKLVQDLIEVK